MNPLIMKGKADLIQWKRCGSLSLSKIIEESVAGAINR